MQPKIMMSAAEVSGDVHGGFLARHLTGCQLFGMGGEKMRVAGVDIRVDITAKSTIGIIEALRYLPSQLIAFHKMKKMLVREKPHALILIDAQGFNMPLAKFAKSKGIRTIYYIAPQEWLWGTQKGVVKVAKTIDLIISIFKQEHDINIKAGGNSVYFGNPLIDLAKPTMTKEAFYRKFGLDPARKVIAMCPGSRPQELKILLPILVRVAKKLGNYQYIMPVSSSRFTGRIKKFVSKFDLGINVIEGFNYDVLAYSDLAIAKSGTIVLESVILGTPVIMFYKLSRLTYYIARNLLKINLPYYSMPNLLAGKMVVPEFVMEEATADNLYNAALKILRDPVKAKQNFDEVRSVLGEEGAAEKSAQKIIEFASS